MIRTQKKMIMTILVYISMITIVVVSAGCEASKDISSSSSKLNRKSYSMTFEEFKRETNQLDFKTKIKINSKKSIPLARNIDGSYELSDFDVDTDIINRLELNDKVTYSFRIYPTIIISAKSIYNLVLEKIDDRWVESIVEFKLTEENYEDVVSGIREKFEGKASLIYASNFDEIVASNECHKVEIVSTHCNGLGACTNEFCDGCIGQEGFGCIEKQYASFCLNNNSMTLIDETDIIDETEIVEPINPEDFSLIPNINDLRKQSQYFVEKNIILTNEIISLLEGEANLNFSNFPNTIDDLNELRTALINSGVTRVDELINLLSERNNLIVNFNNDNKDFVNLRQSTKEMILNDAFDVVSPVNDDMSMSRSCYQQWVIDNRRCTRTFIREGGAAVVAAAGGILPGLAAGAFACWSLMDCKQDALDDYNACIGN